MHEMVCAAFEIWISKNIFGIIFRMRMMMVKGGETLNVDYVFCKMTRCDRWW